jgi:hypothetical protein
MGLLAHYRQWLSPKKDSPRLNKGFLGNPAALTLHLLLMREEGNDG